MSKQGADAHDRIAKTLHEAGICGDEALYSDLWRATRTVVERLLSQKKCPEDAHEMASLVRLELASYVSSRTFLASLIGVKLVDIEELQLGSMLITKSVATHVEKQELSTSKKPEWLWHLLAEDPCIVGTFVGTQNAAKRKFTEQAHLLSGFLAVVAGSRYTRGATAFDIRAVIGTSESSQSSGYLFWDTVDKSVGWGTSGGKGQALEIDKERAAELTESDAAGYGFWLLQKNRRNDVEEAIARAVYWFGDAHRDPVPVMQFVKYWSCIECFFSLGDELITESLAIGVVGTLTFGYLQILQASEYALNKAKAKKLYTKRSKAIHSASYGHISHGDLALLSQWAAITILNLVSFANAGISTRRVLAKHLKAIDAKTLPTT